MCEIVLRNYLAVTIIVNENEVRVLTNSPDTKNVSLLGVGPVLFEKIFTEG